MAICSKCGRNFKGDTSKCKFCQMEEEELEAIKDKLNDFDSYSEPMPLDAFQVFCLKCGSLLHKKRICYNCSGIQLECQCGQINFFITDPLVVPFLEYPPLKTIFACSRCGKINYFCPYCLQPVDNRASFCNSCNRYVFLDYLNDLLNNNICQNFYSELDIYNDSDDNHPLGISNFPNWGFLFSDTDEDNVLVRYKYLKASKDVKRIIDYEQILYTKPFTILLDNLNHIAREIESSEKWSSSHQKLYSSNPSFKNVALNALAYTNENAATKRVLDNINELVKLQVGAYYHGETWLNEIVNKFTGDTLWGLKVTFAEDNRVSTDNKTYLKRIAHDVYFNPEVDGSQRVFDEFCEGL